MSNFFDPLTNHMQEQLNHSRRSKRRSHERKGLTIESVALSDVYLPGKSDTNCPSTAGTNTRFTVLKSGSTIGREVAF